jgi:hypothetical protein
MKLMSYSGVKLFPEKVQELYSGVFFKNGKVHELKL